MKRSVSIIFGIALLTGLFSQSVFAEFYDIGGNRNSEAITWLESNHVVKGYRGNLFKPKNDISRAEFLKILLETAGMDKEPLLSSPFEENTFSDVKPDEWFYDYVAYARTRGIIKGYSDGTFKPNSPIVFSEAIKILSETFYNSDEVDSSCNESADAGNYERYACNDPWYWKYAIFTWKLKIFPEYYEDLNATMMLKVSRGDMAEMTYRAAAVRDYEIDGIYPVYEEELIPNDFYVEEIEEDTEEE